MYLTRRTEGQESTRLVQGAGKGSQLALVPNLKTFQVPSQNLTLPSS